MQVDRMVYFCIFRFNLNFILIGFLVINNFYENYFCIFIKNYYYCIYNVVGNERFFCIIFYKYEIIKMGLNKVQ